MSALRVATGLAAGRPIFYIDTEARRALHYAAMFDFRHGGLEPPFRPDAYREAIEGAVSDGAAVIIVDSLSHEHEGPGGMLEWHEEEVTRMAGSDFAKRDRVNFAAWIKPKAANTKLVGYLERLPCHLILCFRAKDKIKLIKISGRQEPVSIGWQPIASEGIPYSCLALVVLPPGAKGVPDLAAQASKIPDPLIGIIRDGAQLSEQTGEAIAAWAKGDVLSEKTERSQSKPQSALPEDLKIAAKAIAAALRATNKPKDHQRIIDVQTKAGVLDRIKAASPEAWAWLMKQCVVDTTAPFSAAITDEVPTLGENAEEPAAPTEDERMNDGGQDVNATQTTASAAVTFPGADAGSLEIAIPKNDNGKPDIVAWTDVVREAAAAINTLSDLAMFDSANSPIAKKIGSGAQRNFGMTIAQARARLEKAS